VTEEIKPGDVVVLKSGGPKMTVKFVEDGEAACSWFTNDKVSERRFSIEMLALANSSGTIPLSRA
jgi:uncharacterized protein YodC (DUF2158 family)